MRTLQTASSIRSRGVYGQNDQGYQRGGKDSGNVLMSDRMTENGICEGREEATLQRMFKERNWTQLTSYCKELKGKGFSQARIDSILSRATVGRL